MDNTEISCVALDARSCPDIMCQRWGCERLVFGTMLKAENATSQNGDLNASRSSERGVHGSVPAPAQLCPRNRRTADVRGCDHRDKNPEAASLDLALSQTHLCTNANMIIFAAANMISALLSSFKRSHLCTCEGNTLSMSSKRPVGSLPIVCLDNETLIESEEGQRHQCW